MCFSHKQAVHNYTVSLVTQAISLSWALEVIHFFCQILAQAIRFVMIQLLKFIAVHCIACPHLFINFYWKSVFKVDTARSPGHVLPCLLQLLCKQAKPIWEMTFVQALSQAEQSPRQAASHPQPEMPWHLPLLNFKWRSSHAMPWVTFS